MEVPENPGEPIGSRFSHLVLILATILAVSGGYYLKYIQSNSKKKVPPGRLGFPLVGETIGYLRALKQDKVHEWVQEREDRYGPVFKTSIIGAKTVIMNGLAGNRFILGASDNGLVHNLPTSVARIIGKYSLSGLSGPAHKRIRGAIISFLKPESIQRYINQMNSLVHQELLKELSGKDSICVVPLMKKITFKVTCTLLFGLRGGNELDQLLEDYTILLVGAWSIPFNIPGTSFAKALKARARIYRYFSYLIEIKRQKMEAGNLNYQEDVISKFLSENLSDDEIFDNIISLMIASHDTTATLLTLCIRQLARDADVLNMVLHEQTEVIKLINENGGQITWSVTQSMKYTWRVAQEVLRLIPPVLGTFRLAQRETEFGGFVIPKGWQVLWSAPGSHMDESIFKDPKKFDPSRFEKSSGIPPYAYVPFGAGSRVCPGMEFARVQVVLIIHHMVTNYQWTEINRNEPITRQGMPYPAMGLPINLQSRKLSTTDANDEPLY